MLTKRIAELRSILGLGQTPDQNQGYTLLALDTESVETSFPSISAADIV